MIIIEPPDAVTPGRLEFINILKVPHQTHVTFEHFQANKSFLFRSRFEEPDEK